MRHAHVLEQLHILLHLLLVFWTGMAELEVDDMGLLAIGNHSVGASLYHVLLVVGEDDFAFVEYIPL